MKACIVCEDDGLHTIKYTRNFDDYIEWEGTYCNKHLAEKLREMARVWEKRTKLTEGSS